MMKAKTSSMKVLKAWREKKIKDRQFLDCDTSVGLRSLTLYIKAFQGRWATDFSCWLKRNIFVTFSTLMWKQNHNNSSVMFRSFLPSQMTFISHLNCHIKKLKVNKPYSWQIVEEAWRGSQRRTHLEQHGTLLKCLFFSLNDAEMLAQLTWICCITLSAGAYRSPNCWSARSTS